MEPTPAEEADTSRRTQTETDPEAAQHPPDQPPEPERKDDGTVPDKHVGRWKNEGGAWLPED